MSAGSDPELLTDALARLRRRMLLLARLLPAAYVRLLDADLEDLESEASACALLQGLSDSVDFSASDVEAALREVWSRTSAE